MSFEDLVLSSIDEFNEKIIDYLIFFYNCQRPHQVLNNLSLIDFIVRSCLKNNPQERKIYVTYTLDCKIKKNLVLY